MNWIKSCTLYHARPPLGLKKYNTRWSKKPRTISKITLSTLAAPISLQLALPFSVWTQKNGFPHETLKWHWILSSEIWEVLKVSGEALHLKRILQKGKTGRQELPVLSFLREYTASQDPELCMYFSTTKMLTQLNLATGIITDEIVAPTAQPEGKTSVLSFKIHVLLVSGLGKSFYDLWSLVWKLLTIENDKIEKSLQELTTG